MSASIRTPKQFWSMYHSLTPNRREHISQTLSNGTVTANSPTSKVIHFSPAVSLIPLVHLLLPAFHLTLLNFIASSALRRK